jgi:HAD superfamily hydrolase (TIGR01490 family)
MRTGTSIAAFFDLDGTLLPGPSLEVRFLNFLLAQRLLRASSVWKWMVRSAQRAQLGNFGANKKYLEGLPESCAADWAEFSFQQDALAATPRFFAEGLARIAWHQSQNHRVFLISGTLAPVASELLRFLPGEIGLVATGLATCLSCSPRMDFELAPRVWTGELAGEHMVGYAKSRAMVALAARHRLDLRACYAYGDSLSDCAMLEIVRNPEAVNPSLRLARVARRRGWPISRWKQTSAPVDRAQAKLIPITRGVRIMAVEKHS